MYEGWNGVDIYKNDLFQINNYFHLLRRGYDKQLVTMGSLPERMINCDALFASENKGRQVTVIKSRFVDKELRKRRSRLTNV